MATIQELLQITVEKGASDLHIIPDYYPTIRVRNEIIQLNTYDIITKEGAENLLLGLLYDEQRQNLLANKEIDIGFEFGKLRFRINMYFVKNKLAASFRLIPSIIKKLEELNLPPSFYDFTKYNQGLVLVTGPTGEGKSTTLATLINEINQRDAKHIVTIEDPIEFVYPQARSVISQRELHQDTHSWTAALKSVLREDPDVVLIGEMRDYDTIQSAITVAETGHLVFGTLHTSSTPEAINRIIDIFPSAQQNQIRSQLASVLKAIVTQRLMPTIDNTAQIPGVEILINIPSVASLIRDGKTFLIDNVIETEEKQGMMIFEKYLAKLYHEGKISRDTAMNFSVRPNVIKKFLL